MAELSNDTEDDKTDDDVDDDKTDDDDKADDGDDDGNPGPLRKPHKKTKRLRGGAAALGRTLSALEKSVFELMERTQLGQAARNRLSISEPQELIALAQGHKQSVDALAARLHLRPSVLALALAARRGDAVCARVSARELARVQGVALPPDVAELLCMMALASTNLNTGTHATESIVEATKLCVNIYNHEKRAEKNRRVLDPLVGTAAVSLCRGHVWTFVECIEELMHATRRRVASRDDVAPTLPTLEIIRMLGRVIAHKAEGNPVRDDIVNILKFVQNHAKHAQTEGQATTHCRCGCVSQPTQQMYGGTNASSWRSSIRRAKNTLRDGSPVLACLVHGPDEHVARPVVLLIELIKVAAGQLSEDEDWRMSDMLGLERNKFCLLQALFALAQGDKPALRRFWPKCVKQLNIRDGDETAYLEGSNALLALTRGTDVDTASVIRREQVTPLMAISALSIAATGADHDDAASVAQAAVTLVDDASTSQQAIDNAHAWLGTTLKTDPRALVGICEVATNRSCREGRTAVNTEFVIAAIVRKYRLDMMRRSLRALVAVVTAARIADVKAELVMVIQASKLDEGDNAKDKFIDAEHWFSLAAPRADALKQYPGHDNVEMNELLNLALKQYPEHDNDEMNELLEEPDKLRMSSSYYNSDRRFMMSESDLRSKMRRDRRSLAAHAIANLGNEPPIAVLDTLFDVHAQHFSAHGVADAAKRAVVDLISVPYKHATTKLCSLAAVLATNPENLHVTVALARAYSAGVDDDEDMRGERERAVEEFVHTVTATSYEEMDVQEEVKAVVRVVETWRQDQKISAKSRSSVQECSSDEVSRFVLGALLHNTAHKDRTSFKEASAQFLKSEVGGANLPAVQQVLALAIGDSSHLGTDPIQLRRKSVQFKRPSSIISTDEGEGLFRSSSLAERVCTAWVGGPAGSDELARLAEDAALAINIFEVSPIFAAFINENRKETLPNIEKKIIEKKINHLKSTPSDFTAFVGELMTSWENHPTKLAITSTIKETVTARLRAQFTRAHKGVTKAIRNAELSNAIALASWDMNCGNFEAPPRNPLDPEIVSALTVLASSAAVGEFKTDADSVKDARRRRDQMAPLGERCALPPGVLDGIVAVARCDTRALSAAVVRINNGLNRDKRADTNVVHGLVSLADAGVTGVEDLSGALSHADPDIIEALVVVSSGEQTDIIGSDSLRRLLRLLGLEVRPMVALLAMLKPRSDNAPILASMLSALDVQSELLRGLLAVAHAGADNYENEGSVNPLSSPVATNLLATAARDLFRAVNITDELAAARFILLTHGRVNVLRDAMAELGLTDEIELELRIAAVTLARPSTKRRPTALAFGGTNGGFTRRSQGVDDGDIWAISRVLALRSKAFGVRAFNLLIGAARLDETVLTSLNKLEEVRVATKGDASALERLVHWCQRSTRAIVPDGASFPGETGETVENTLRDIAKKKQLEQWKREATSMVQTLSAIAIALHRLSEKTTAEEESLGLVFEEQHPQPTNAKPGEPASWAHVANILRLCGSVIDGLFVHDGSPLWQWNKDTSPPCLNQTDKPKEFQVLESKQGSSYGTMGGFVVDGNVFGSFFEMDLSPSSGEFATHCYVLSALAIGDVSLMSERKPWWSNGKGTPANKLPSLEEEEEEVCGLLSRLWRSSATEAKQSMRFLVLLAHGSLDAWNFQSNKDNGVADLATGVSSAADFAIGDDELPVLRALATLAHGDLKAMDEVLDVLVAGLLGGGQKSTSTSKRSQTRSVFASLLTVGLESATVDENVQAIEVLAPRLGLAPSIARAFVVGNCRGTQVEEMAEVIAPFCADLRVHPTAASAIMVSVAATRRGECALACHAFLTLCQELPMHNSLHHRPTSPMASSRELLPTIAETVGAIAVGDMTTIERGLEPLLVHVGMIAAENKAPGEVEVERGSGVERRKRLLTQLVRAAQGDACALEWLVCAKVKLDATTTSAANRQLSADADDGMRQNPDHEFSKETALYSASAQLNSGIFETRSHLPATVSILEEALQNNLLLRRESGEVSNGVLSVLFGGALGDFSLLAKGLQQRSDEVDDRSGRSPLLEQGAWKSARNLVGLFHRIARHRIDELFNVDDTNQLESWSNELPDWLGSCKGVSEREHALRMFLLLISADWHMLRQICLSQTRQENFDAMVTSMLFSLSDDDVDSLQDSSQELKSQAKNKPELIRELLMLAATRTSPLAKSAKMTELTRCVMHDHPLKPDGIENIVRALLRMQSGLVMRKDLEHVAMVLIEFILPEKQRRKERIEFVLRPCSGEQLAETEAGAEVENSEQQGDAVSDEPISATEVAKPISATEVAKLMGEVLNSTEEDPGVARHYDRLPSLGRILHADQHILTRDDLLLIQGAIAVLSPNDHEPRRMLVGDVQSVTMSGVGALAEAFGVDESALSGVLSLARGNVTDAAGEIAARIGCFDVEKVQVAVDLVTQVLPLIDDARDVRQRHTAPLPPGSENMTLEELFKHVDDDGSRSLDVEEFIHLFKLMGLPLSDQKAMELFSCGDMDVSGLISIDELEDTMSALEQQVCHRAFEALGVSIPGLLAFFSSAMVSLAFILIFISFGIAGLTKGDAFSAIVNSVLPVGFTILRAHVSNAALSHARDSRLTSYLGVACFAGVLN